MVISDRPMFDSSDQAAIAPKDGIWISDDEECRFDSGRPEREWPECALWIVVRNSGRQLLLVDGKGQSQTAIGIFAAGSPVIVQGEWVDDAKQPAASHYGFFAVEPGRIGSDQRFAEALAWPVECGVQDGPTSDIQPFAGISAECRPSSKDSIRSAALSSARAEQISWRWLRAESR